MNNKITEDDLLRILTKIQKNNCLYNWNHFKQMVANYIRMEWEKPTNKQLLSIVLQFVDNPNYSDINTLSQVLSREELEILIATFWTYLDQTINQTND